MHLSAKVMCKAFHEAYCQGSDLKTVIDIGSQDVNGSLKEIFVEMDYTGVDFVAGRGVDVVLDDPYKLPFPDESVDVVLCSSCFEHSEMFWLLYLEIMRILKPKGLFYLQVPSNGPFHRYPVDCWRFYPDSGKALVTWAKRNNYNPVVLESFIGNQYADGWNNFVAVYAKDEAHASSYKGRILNNYASYTNAVLEGEADLLKKEELPEDQRNFSYWLKKKQWRLQKRLRRLRKDASL